MGAGVYIDFQPDLDIVGARFGRIADGFRTFRVPLEASVRQVMIPSITENFIVGGRPAWEPLSEKTVARREKQGTIGGFSNDILVESGTLMGAATALARWTIGPQEAAYSNLPGRAWYGAIHQHGNAHTPARPFAVMQDEDRLGIHTIFDRWVNSVVRVNWKGTRF